MGFRMSSGLEFNTSFLVVKVTWDDLRSTDGCWSKASCGCCVPAPLGVIYRQNLGSGKPSITTSQSGEMMALFLKFRTFYSASWKRSDGYSMTFGRLTARRFAPAALRLAGEKKSRESEPNDHALGRSRGGYGTKVHVIVDGRGVPLGMHLTGGQAHELTALESLLDPDVGTPILHDVEPAALAADKGYSASWARERIQAVNWRPIIPTKSNEKLVTNESFDRMLYRQRNVVERCIGWLKECRRIATRYEKLAVSYLAMLRLACIQRYFRTLERIA